MARKKTNKNIEAETALEALKPSLDDNKIAEINTALASTNYSELADFITRFGVSKDAQLIIRVLARLQDTPQVMCGENEFYTICNAAKMDGQREILRKFTQLVAYSLDGNREMIELEMNKRPLI